MERKRKLLVAIEFLSSSSSSSSSASSDSSDEEDVFVLDRTPQNRSKVENYQNVVNGFSEDEVWAVK